MTFSTVTMTLSTVTMEIEEAKFKASEADMVSFPMSTTMEYSQSRPEYQVVHQQAQERHDSHI
jgi:hypothetical protein